MLCINRSSFLISGKGQLLLASPEVGASENKLDLYKVYLYFSLITSRAVTGVKCQPSPTGGTGREKSYATKELRA